jgi:hypothetical protein
MCICDRPGRGPSCVGSVPAETRLSKGAETDGATEVDIAVPNFWSLGSASSNFRPTLEMDSEKGRPAPPWRSESWIHIAVGRCWRMVYDLAHRCLLSPTLSWQHDLTDVKRSTR